MAALGTGKKAPLLDQDGGQLNTTKHNVQTSDVNAVKLVTSAGVWFASNANTSAAPVTATITATRIFDGAMATLDITAAPVVPFSISLGAESAA